jgi:arsenite methyltransferase
MTVASAAVDACCAYLYGHPLVELVAGVSLHPGGLAGTRRLLHAARLPRRSALLDVGCGLGASSRLAADEFGLDVDACDISGAAIRRARTLAADAGSAVRFVEASLPRLPFEDGRFAGVLAECVLSTTAKGQALAELRRVMAAGGPLLLTDVTATDDVGAQGLLAVVLCLEGAWRQGELEDLAVSNGFAIERAWDESDGITALLDRLEARIGLLATLARDLPAAEPLAGQIPSLDSKPIAGAFREARRLVREGRIGYRAVVARAAGSTADGDQPSMVAAMYFG